MQKVEEMQPEEKENEEEEVVVEIEEVAEEEVVEKEEVVEEEVVEKEEVTEDWKAPQPPAQPPAVELLWVFNCVQLSRGRSVTTMAWNKKNPVTHTHTHTSSVCPSPLTMFTLLQTGLHWAS